MECMGSADVASAHAKSRSTSAGSSRCSSGEASEARALAARSVPPEEALPDYEYPATFSLSRALGAAVDEHSPPVYVKNTFIEAELDPSSLLGAHERRQTQSCPASILSAPPGLEDECTAAAKLLHRSVTTGSEAFASALRAQADAPNGTMSKHVARSPPATSQLHEASGGEGARGGDGAPAGRQRVGDAAFDFEYPAFVVKNTFIDTGVHPSSLRGSFGTRQIQSCPASGASPPLGLDGEAQESAALPSEACRVDENEPLGHSDIMMQAFGFHGFAGIPPPPPMPPVLCLRLAQSFPAYPVVAPAGAPPAPCLDFTVGFSQQPLPPDSVSSPKPPAPSPPNTARVLRLSEALGGQAPEEPALGSPELPTVGSAAHYCGSCKPCAHVEKRGCQSGVNCLFCHLCLPGELKRRQKAKRAGGSRNARAGLCSSHLSGTPPSRAQVGLA